MKRAHLHEVLEVLSAPMPSPAAVSAAAVTAAAGVSLLVMAAEATAQHLPEGSERSTVLELGKNAHRYRTVMEDVYEQDAKAYARVLEVRKLPKGPERRERLERAWKTATIIPGAMGRVAMICLKIADELSQLAIPAAKPDIATAAWLCHAAIQASLIVVQSNLTQISDEEFKEKIRRNLSFLDDRDRLLQSIIHQTVQK